MKKQLKIWKDDFARYWDKTNLVGRIMIGAGISLGLTYVVINKVNKPISEEVKKLKKNAPATVVGTPEEDPEIIDSEIKLKSARSKLKIWQKKANELKAEQLMAKAELATAINEIRTMLALNGLRLREESYFDYKAEAKKAKVSRRRRRSAISEKAAPTLRQVLKVPSTVDMRVYKYKATGTYINVCHFLWMVRAVEHSLQLTNIKMERIFRRPDGDKNISSKKSVSLILTFDLVLYFESDNKSLAVKPNKKTVAKKK